MGDSSDNKPKRKRIAIPGNGPIATSNEKKISAGIISNAEKNNKTQKKVQLFKDEFIPVEEREENIPQQNEQVVFANPIPSNEKAKQKRMRRNNKTDKQEVKESYPIVDFKDSAILDDMPIIHHHDPDLIDDSVMTYTASVAEEDPIINYNDPAILKDDEEEILQDVNGIDDILLDDFTFTESLIDDDTAGTSKGLEVKELKSQEEIETPKEVVMLKDPAILEDEVELPVEDPIVDKENEVAYTEQWKLISEANFDGSVTAEGVLEITNDTCGFLRSSDYNYLSSPDDIYVSMSQIKLFGLKNGDTI
ncbi:MAG: hypothetical protein RR356_07520, partial [Bacteroidales bacterium]